MLQSASHELKDTVRSLINHVAELNDVTHAIQGKNYCFYHGKADARNLFATFLLTGKALKVEIVTDPSVEFQDPERWTGDSGHKPHFPWLLGRKQKKEFTIASKEQVKYAIELITQAYLQTLPTPHEMKKSPIYATSDQSVAERARARAGPMEF